MLRQHNECVLCSNADPTVLLHAWGSEQGGWMAFSVVYFRFTHPLGRPHYVWDECEMMMIKGRENVKPGAVS